MIGRFLDQFFNYMSKEIKAEIDGPKSVNRVGSLPGSTVTNPCDWYVTPALIRAAHAYVETRIGQ
jgi:hypothetical protein